MQIYSLTDLIPLSYTRMRAGSIQTGLTVTVQVIDATTNATLLATRTITETANGNGVYQYRWTHGLTQDTQCEVVYTVNGQKYVEMIFITNNAAGGRSI